MNEPPHKWANIFCSDNADISVRVFQRKIGNNYLISPCPSVRQPPRNRLETI